MANSGSATGIWITSPQHLIIYALHLKLPNGLSNPNIVFTNMNIHTSTICLHQAAIYKADKNHLPASISAESKVRCITAANEIASVMRMISHMDLSAVSFLYSLDAST